MLCLEHFSMLSDVDVPPPYTASTGFEGHQQGAPGVFQGQTNYGYASPGQAQYAPPTQGGYVNSYNSANVVVR